MLTRFDAMDTKMEHLATAIKSGETTQNRTILQIQHQLETVCSSLHLLVQQIGIQQPTRPLQLSQVEPLTQNLPSKP
jgi:alpha-D-ribose 1-methylphosphonate 5-phosphate C-P lyase